MQFQTTTDGVRRVIEADSQQEAAQIAERDSEGAAQVIALRDQFGAVETTEWPMPQPGPWTVQMMSRDQPRRFHVARQVEDGTWSSPHWDQMRADDGSIARFETAEEASAAIAKAKKGGAA